MNALEARNVVPQGKPRDRDELEKEPQQLPTTQKMRLTVVVPTNLRSRHILYHFENGVTNGTTKLPRVNELQLRAF